VFELFEARRVTTRPRKTIDEAGADRIRHKSKHDRHATGALEQESERCAACRNYHVRCERCQLGSVLANLAGAALAPAIIDPQVQTLHPSQFGKLGEKGGVAGACSGLVHDPRHHAQPPDSCVLLRSRRERPGCRRAAEQRDERAPFHSITSSAATSSLSGTVSPSIVAV